MTAAADLLSQSHYAGRARRRQPTPEGAILRTILDGLAAHRVRAYRLNSGATVVPETATTRRRFIRYGSPGLPDVMVMLAGGRVGFCEVKTARGRLSPDQVAFRRDCLERQVPHCVARSWADVAVWLQAWGVPVASEGAAP